MFSALLAFYINEVNILSAEVFISHHTATCLPVTEEICRQLEMNAVRCWYAPRDTHGAYAGSIFNAISECKVFIVVLNKESSYSLDVLNEIEIAFDRLRDGDDIELIPFRITDDEISPDAKYYLKRMHWIEARSESMNADIQALTERVLNLPGIANSRRQVSDEDAFELLGNVLLEYRGTAQSVHIPPDVATIETLSNTPCPSITEVYLHEAVACVGWNAFVNCTSLKTISVSADNPSYKSIDGVLYTKDGSAVVCYPQASPRTEYALPDTVKEIGWGAFYGCSNLKTIHLPDSVAVIGAAAFTGCSNLEALALPDSVQEIGMGAFSHCTGLTAMHLPDSVKESAPFVFSGCSGLKKLYLSHNTVLDETAFASCPEQPELIYTDEATADTSDFVIRDGILKQYTGEAAVVTVPQGVTVIGRGAFQDHETITEVHLPDSLSTIGSNAFKGCTNLTKVNIPDSVTDLQYGAFYACHGLAEIRIPPSVRLLRGGTFAWCTKLEKVYLSRNTQAEERAFFHCPQNRRLFYID